MKKSIINAAIVAATLAACPQLGFCASDMPYEPVFENVPITEAITTTASTQTSTTPAVKSIAPASSTSTAKTTSTSPAASATSLETGKLQNALMQLDSAQVEIRNQLIQYKSEYATLDNQYKTIKEQRAAKAKLVKETEKKIKELDSTKEKIRKNMNY